MVPAWKFKIGITKPQSWPLKEMAGMPSTNIYASTILRIEKKVYKTLDARFLHSNSDKVEKAIAAMSIISEETSQNGNYNDMPALKEKLPIICILIPPRKVRENTYSVRTKMSCLDDGA